MQCPIPSSTPMSVPPHHALNEELVRKKGISICELLFFKIKDFQEELQVGVKNGIEMARN